MNRYELIAAQDYKIACRKGKTHIFIVYFDGDISKITLTEGAGFAFFSKTELDRMKLVDWERNALEKYFNKIK
jgi:hypothetical protein